MDFGNELKHAMLNNNIKGAKELSKLADMPYGKVLRALQGDTSSRIVDVARLGEVLNLRMTFEAVLKID